MSKKFRNTCIILMAGIAYFIWIKITNIAMPCIFRMVTGRLCPGCGITSLILCITKLDFKGAFNANPFLFITSPFLTAEIIYYFFLRNGKKVPGWNNILIIIYVIALIIFGILRNS